MSISIVDIKKIVSLQLGIREINDGDRFLEDLDAESLDVMNIVVAVEESFQVEIKESEIPYILTSKDLFNLVKGRL